MVVLPISLLNLFLYCLLLLSSYTTPILLLYYYCILLLVYYYYCLLLLPPPLLPTPLLPPPLLPTPLLCSCWLNWAVPLLLLLLLTKFDWVVMGVYCCLCCQTNFWAVQLLLYSSYSTLLYSWWPKDLALWGRILKLSWWLLFGICNDDSFHTSKLRQWHMQWCEPFYAEAKTMMIECPR